jgi:hypothetical protein
VIGASRGGGFSFAVAILFGASACTSDQPIVTYIGVVDATPPRLGRPLTAALPAEASTDAEAGADADASADADANADAPGETSAAAEGSADGPGETGTDASQDAVVDAPADQGTDSGELISDGSTVEGEASPEAGSE